MFILMSKRVIGKIVSCQCENVRVQGMSDHFLVEAGFKVPCQWRNKKTVESVRNVLKVS